MLLHAKQRHLPGRYLLTVASVGDTRCVLYPTTRPVNGWRQLTKDHTAEKPVEAMRINTSGGTIKRQLAEVSDLSSGVATGPSRVYPGGLKLTRSIGNTDCCEGVIATPDVIVTEVPPEGAKIVIASNGLWSAIGNKE
eukprot:6005966-Pyramimonas_sp.AAC.1